MNMYIALSVFIILNTIMNLNELIVTCICIAWQVMLSYIIYTMLCQVMVLKSHPYYALEQLTV